MLELITEGGEKARKKAKKSRKKAEQQAPGTEGSSES
jgi:hypothetical protein